MERIYRIHVHGAFLGEFEVIIYQRNNESDGLRSHRAYFMPMDITESSGEITAADQQMANDIFEEVAGLRGATELFLYTYFTTVAAFLASSERFGIIIRDPDNVSIGIKFPRRFVLLEGEHSEFLEEKMRANIDDIYTYEDDEDEYEYQDIKANRA